MKFTKPQSINVVKPRRSPCGERGLKYTADKDYLPNEYSRSPCGERGLKYILHIYHSVPFRRSPCGERGLKCVRGRK